MHMMIFYIIHLYRAESSQSYMKGYMSDLHPFFLYLVKKLLCKMKAGCRSCRTALMFGVNGLIPIFVLKFVGNIRRQRHFSQFIQDLLENPLIFKPDQPVSFLYDIDNLPHQKAIAEADPGSYFCLFPRF